jgi:hypothetical protein
MKKWLIFAVIAAMFAMVMFTACPGGDDGGGAASGVTVTKMYDKEQVSGEYPAGTALVAYNITWEGVDGYDYYVYYEKKDPSGQIEKATNQVKGQTVYSFDKMYDNASPSVLVTTYAKLQDAGDKNSWAILVCPTSYGALTEYTAAPTLTGGYSGDVVYPSNVGDHGSTAAAALWGVFSTDTTTEYRIGVVAHYPGGYPFEEKREVVYSTGWFKHTVD